MFHTLGGRISSALESGVGDTAFDSWQRRSVYPILHFTHIVLIKLLVSLGVMHVGRALFKITVINVGFGVINPGHCCLDILSVTDILGYNQVFIHIQLSLFLVTLRSFPVRNIFCVDENYFLFSCDI